MFSDPKLPDLPHRAARRSEPNAWLAADRRDKTKSAAVFLLVVALLAAGLWLLVGGLTA